MSLFFKESIEKSPLTYVYILLCGFGSLLMLFLIRQSLPFKEQKAKEYHLNIQAANQELLALDKIALQSQYIASSADNKLLNFQLNNAQTSIDRLKEIPILLGKSQSVFLYSKLETIQILLNNQANFVRQSNTVQKSLNSHCQQLEQIKKNYILNLKNISELEYLANNLLENAILYCDRHNTKIRLIIENQLVKTSDLINNEDANENNYRVISLIKYVEDILADRERFLELNHQIKVPDIIHKLSEFENLYLNNIDRLKDRIQTYRFCTYLLLLLITIFVANRIIRKLTKTNRNIVKILEGFTQELETKVEQRTALLEESIQNTEAALAQAQNANKAKSRFLANMSHELRTPLNAILGFTQLMCRDSSVSKEHQENIQIINRSGEHLLKLINDILEMSKIEVGQITLNEVKFDLYMMLKSIEDMLQLKAKSKNIGLTFDIASNVPKYVYTDEGKLRQIIINLLGNALKFTQKGKISLTVELKDNAQLEEANIDFLFNDTHLLNFAVTDTGPGISANEMERLFSPFEQTEIGRTSNEGTGLGLSISQKFVELMGGKLKVSSTVGKGSTFSFGILIKRQDIDLPSSIHSNQVNHTGRVIGIAPGQLKHRILAVDDVPASRLLLRKMLTEIGFAVEEAGDGQQAVELYSSWHPHLILMDMRMPVMDGYEATKQIKSLPNGKETVIIALTASAFEEERVVILSAGCDDFMRKPFYEAELLEKIGQYLNINYLYEETVDVVSVKPKSEFSSELSRESLEVMPLKWRSQLYDAAAKVDNQEILQLLSDIPEEYESLAEGLENLVEHFRCDKIIDLTKSAN